MMPMSSQSALFLAHQLETNVHYRFVLKSNLVAAYKVGFTFDNISLPGLRFVS